MAWRIAEAVIGGEIDNRTAGQITGRLWILGRDEPLTLELKGNAWRDLAGHRVKFTNPSPQAANLEGLAAQQVGVAGDITASHKVKVPEIPPSELLARYESREPFPYHWANCLYLEWYSEANGRVVIESPHYEITVDGPAVWTLTDEQEREQQRVSQEAAQHFMQRLEDAIAAQPPGDVDDTSDQPTSRTEAEADEEAAWMDRLNQRIGARLEREGPDAYDQIYEEEREKIRQERGEPEPEPLTPEQEAEQAAWIEEMNQAAEAALEEVDLAAEQERAVHPTLTQAKELCYQLYRDVREGEWIPASATSEHPLQEVLDGVSLASAKLAGALGGFGREDEWPPPPLFAGDKLVRLKKARRSLRDALAGLDAADEERLADADWRRRTRHAVSTLLTQVEQLIREVRGVLED